MKHSIFLLTFAIVLFCVASSLNAQVLFRAFHETEAPIPGKKVEDAKEWSQNSVTPNANVFDVADGKLVQTGNECAATTKTLLPGVDGADWTDYTLVFDVWWKDDDGVAAIARYRDDASYYSFVTGGTDGHFGNNWFLGLAVFTEKACFGDGGEKKDVLEQGPTGLNVDNAGPFTMMLRVKGSKIEGFFGEQVSQADLLAGKTPPKMGEIDDKSFKRGSAAIGTSTNPSQFANIQVFGPGGPQAVDVKDKLTTAWGTIKLAR